MRSGTGEPLSTPEVCIFCERPDRRGLNLGTEHAFPQWLRKAVPGESRLLLHEFEATGKEDRKWRAQRPDFWAQGICERCNNGWMEGLEESARPILERMIDPQRALSLDPRQQSILRLWFGKTAGTLATMHHPSLPPDFYVRLYELRRPPRHLQVLLECYGGRAPGVDYMGA